MREDFDPPLTVEEIKAILHREEVAESTGVLKPDEDKVRLCRYLLELLGEANEPSEDK